MKIQEEYKMFIGGKWISSEKKIDVKNPYDKSIISKVHIGSKDDIKRAIKESQKAFLITKKLPGYKRRDILNHLARLLEENKEHHANVLSLESAKTITDSIAEIDRAISTLTISAEEATRIGGEVMPLDVSSTGEGKIGIIKRFPIGPIAGISPFNFPLNLGMHKIAPAIASGNTIILKPASSTPLSLLLFAKLIEQTDLPKGAVNILAMDRNAADPLVEDERIKLLTFTGSPIVGWELKKRAGKKKVVLELGGNAGVIVDKDSDLDHAADRILTGAFSYQGQVCISVQRAYVHKDKIKEFSEILIEKAKKIKIGDPMEKNTEFGPMIDEQNAVRIESWVNESVRNGAKVIYGGKRNGSEYMPTILTETDPKDKIVCLEAFGPVLTLEPFNTFEEALDMLNDSIFGLQAGIFTNDHKNIMKAYETLDVGGVIVNDIPTFRVDNYPYGGIKESGLGREGVKYAIEDMTELKILVLQ